MERALEVFEKTGVSKSTFRSDRKVRFADVAFVTPYEDSDREALYDRIGKRVDAMFAEGLVDETRGLIEKFGPDAFGLRTIGYAETVAYLEGSATLEETVELVKKNTRNYAKRQVTWNKRYAGLPHLA